KLGLRGPVSGSHHQPVDLVKQTIENKLFSLNDSALVFLEDFLFFPTLEGMKLNAGEVLFVGYGIEDENYNDYQGLDVKGKVVMFLPGEPFGPDSNSYITGTREFSEWTTNQEKKLQLLEEKGAAGILMVSKSVKTYGKNYRNHFAGSAVKLRSDLGKEEEKPGTLYISPETAGKILATASLSLSGQQQKIASSGRPASAALKADIRIDISRKSEPMEASNVLGYLEGRDPELKKELIVLTAHHDHEGIVDGEIYNGADDDGSGVTAVLEMAEAFAKAAKAGKGPRRSILFMTVTAEEKGLLGSRYYSENPVFPLENTITNLNIDMIGRVDSAHADNPGYVYIIGSDKLSTELHAINEKANATYTRLELDYKYNDPADPNRFYYRSDHYNFAKHGIPIVFYFNGVHEDYHKPTDDIDKIDFEALCKRAQLVFYTAWELANRDKRPVVDVKNAFPESP
ncbi:MAG TPA: M28 family peptidase, partial [Anseongella sp.]|nr:M28 family peptidase [Anseongella sp.]